ncbi:uncharacterized protein [Haliotis asinina]|uniref:uncharacterized protein n=1 Tax=Haliotis asinina TaxID=109174 RepID=UPI003531C4C6
MNALHAAMLILVLSSIVSPSFGFVWGHWSEWTEVSATPCDSLCGEGSRIVRKERKCVGGLVCRPINGGFTETTESCNIQSCQGICQPGCISNIPNPASNTSYYRCEKDRAVLMNCPETTTWSHCTKSCR